jgi:hypothetical protein
MLHSPRSKLGRDAPKGGFLLLVQRSGPKSRPFPHADGAQASQAASLLPLLVSKCGTACPGRDRSPVYQLFTPDKYCPCNETLRPPGELNSLSNGWHLLPDGNKREKATHPPGCFLPFVPSGNKCQPFEIELSSPGGRKVS